MMREFVSARSLGIALFVSLVSGCAPLFWTGEKPHIDIVNIVPREMRLMEQTLSLFF
jgi:hypothetical protein